ncbi:MAG: hypothetical protein H7X89_03630 [Rhizobiales bacterium]|nr:hypothetical protein [Hyphomicrobiales bacterium]
MKISIKFLLASIVIASAQPALACQVYTEEHASNEADIIFTGTPEKISNLPESGELKPADVVFEVTKQLKGTFPETITIRDTGNNCYGFPQFEKGGLYSSNEYLVFAVKKDGRYETFHPLPNNLVTDNGAQAFIKSSNIPSPPEPQ